MSIAHYHLVHICEEQEVKVHLHLMVVKVLAGVIRFAVRLDSFPNTFLTTLRPPSENGNKREKKNLIVKYLCCEEIRWRHR